MVDNKQEPWYYSKTSTNGKKVFDQKYLKSMTPFLLYLVIYFLGSRFNILRMSWYRCMTPFRGRLKLVTNKYLFQCHDSFPGIDYNPNKEVLSGMSNLKMVLQIYLIKPCIIIGIKS